MNIQVIQIHTNNFKNLTATCNTKGKNFTISGGNGEGKTTLWDSYTWCLFDEDSAGRSNFQIKSLDKDGQPIHHMEHTVKVILSIDGTLLVLEKKYTEKRKKNEDEEGHGQLEGHTTHCYVDGVKVSKTVYNETINQYVDKDTFRLLSSPTGFNSLHWTKRRQLLMECFGNLTMQQVVDANPSLAPIIPLLGSHTTDQKREAIKASLSTINAELKALDIRQREVRHNLPADLLAPDAAQALKEEKAALETEEAACRHQLRQLLDRDDLRRLQQQAATAQQQEANISRLKEDISRLRHQWETTAAETISHPDNCTCPLCGQNIPESQRQATREKAQQQFTEKQEKKLAAITQQGQEKSRQLASLESQLTEPSTEILKQLKQIKDDIKTEEGRLRHQLTTLETSLARLRDLLANTTAAEKAQGRAEELKAEEARHKEERKNLKGQLALIDAYTRAKVAMLQHHINQHFQMAEFKLFDTLLNGDIVECCETLYKGVPYHTNLNHGHRIQVGLDIINTFSRHLNLTLPVFIDNRESITQLPPTNAQVISLVVSKDNPALHYTPDHSIMPLKHKKAPEAPETPNIPLEAPQIPQLPAAALSPGF